MNDRFVLEGPSHPDVFITTSDAIVVMEGKRTELGPTTHTKWMRVRHQMLRHIDAAWDLRDGKAVFGMFIADASTTSWATGVWKNASTATYSDEALDQSLPHRTAAERQAIARSFVGVTSWQATIRHLNLPTILLIDTVDTTHP